MFTVDFLVSAGGYYGRFVHLAKGKVGVIGIVYRIIPHIATFNKYPIIRMLPRNNRAQLSRLAVPLQSEQTGWKFSRLAGNGFVERNSLRCSPLVSSPPPTLGFWKEDGKGGTMQPSGG
jgi:hypothetical protein